jgi:hypothetical protein
MDFARIDRAIACQPAACLSCRSHGCTGCGGSGLRSRSSRNTGNVPVSVDGTGRQRCVSIPLHGRRGSRGHSTPLATVRQTNNPRLRALIYTFKITPAYRARWKPRISSRRPACGLRQRRHLTVYVLNATDLCLLGFHYTVEKALLPG